MPYRRLPNTDVSRLRALKLANEKGKELPPFKLAFSQSTLQKIQSFLPGYEKAMIESRQAFSNQVNKSKDYVSVMKKAKLYISHFIQVINMAVMRGDLSGHEKAFFGLPDNARKLPKLHTEADLIKWGEKIIHGETLRTMEGRASITNPTMAVVKVRYEKFLDAYKFQKMLQKNSQRTQERMEELRKQANELVTEIWNEVEKKFEHEPDHVKRDKSKLYGIVYVMRKNELKKLTPA